MIFLAKLWLHRLPLPVTALIACAFLAAQSTRPSVPEKIRLVEITSRLGISQPPLSPVPDSADLAPISSDKFSLEYASQHLIPLLGGSIAVSVPDKEGRRYLYLVIPGGVNHLFRQNPGGSFDDVTEKTKVQEPSSDLGAAFGDFDHSGRPSLFVAGLNGLRLYRNNGAGAFIDVTDKAGLRGKPGELATSVLLFDADGDGYLDVLETIYTDFSVPPAKTSFVFPNDFAGASSRLYRNQHDGTFRDITEEAGLDSNPGRTRGAVVADFNGKGRMDLLLVRDNKPPLLYRNQGRGKFEDGTWEAGEGGEIWQYAFFSAQATDFNHDGRPDLALWSTISDEVLWNNGKGEFENEQPLVPLIFPAKSPFGFHGTVIDFERGYGSLLTVDAKEKWHCLVNRHGKFADVAVEFVTEKSGASPPAFAWMSTAHLRSSTAAQVLGLTIDGRVMVFEIRNPGSDKPEAAPARAK
jgi:hypothetical protein